ncbi:MAG TPA: GldG family protein [Pseudomonadota bacterium]|nr:GldG family protein [Pseudomonadota bacterium]
MAKPLSKGKTGANAIGFVVLTIAALGAANFVGTRFFKRLDMTSEKVYTLSQGSKDLVKNLPDRLNVKLFMSEDLKPPFKQHAQFVRDLLSEYETYSEGKLKLEVIKIGEGDSKKEEEAQKYKVQKSNRGVVSANKFEIGSTFLGVGFDYHGEIESIPIIENDAGLEFEISGLIKQMTVKKRKIAFASSEGELTPGGGHGSGLQILSEQLKKTGYETTTAELKAAIPPDVDALLIVGAKQPFTDRAKYVVDQFLMRGKSVGVFVDGQVLQTPRGMMMPGMDMPQIAQNNEANLDDLLSAYGVKIKQDIVLDMQNYIGPVQVGGQMLGVNHPVFLVAGPLPQVHQINTGLKAAIFPYASSLELVGEAKEGKGNVTFTKLAETSKESWRPQGPFVFMPTQRARDMTIGTDKGPFPLAYAASGKFKSAFAGKQAVKEDGSKVDGNVSQPGVDPMVSESPATARLVVIGDSEFISDQYVNLGLRSGLQLYVANLAYALNIVDWLAQDEALAQVRNKGMQSRPLDQVKEGTVTLIKAGNIIGLPLLLLLIGLIRWRIRSSARTTAKL